MSFQGLQNLKPQLKQERIQKAKEAKAKNKHLAELQALNKYLQDNDPPSYQAIQKQTIGQSFGFLCERYGLPNSTAWQIEYKHLINLLREACTLFIKGEPFVLLEIPEYKKLLAGFVQPSFEGLKIQILSRSKNGLCFAKTIHDDDSEGFCMIVEPRQFTDLNKKYRAMNLD